MGNREILELYLVPSSPLNNRPLSTYRYANSLTLYPICNAQPPSATNRIKGDTQSRNGERGKGNKHSLRVIVHRNLRLIL